MAELPRIVARGFWLAFLTVLWCRPSLAAASYEPSLGDPLSEPWRWRTFAELSGLGADCIAEGPAGSIWFGTGEGAWEYDGLDWRFHTSDGGAGVGILTLCNGGDGSLYAGGRSGITRYREGQWSHVFPLGTEDFGNVNRMAIAADGSLWAATTWGVLHDEKSHWTLYTGPNIAERYRTNPWPQLRIELLPDTVLRKPRPKPASKRWEFFDVCVARDGCVWFGTEGGEILRFDPAAHADRWALFNESDGVMCGVQPSILQMQDETVWVVYAGHSGYANVFDGHAWRSFNLAEAGAPGDCANLLQTRDGVVWVSGRYVVGALRRGQWKVYEKPDTPIPSARNFIIEASDGALWMGGPSTEVMRLDYETPRWRTYQDLNFQWESPAGGEWFLHRDGRVVVHGGDQWTAYGVEDGVIDAPVALVGTSDGVVWVAGSHEHRAATARFDGHAWHRDVHEKFAWGVDWRGVLVASDGSVWFSAAVDSSAKQDRAGILQYRDGQWIHHRQPRAYATNEVQPPASTLPVTQHPEPVGKFLCLGESKDGRIWAGRNILAFNDGQAWQVFTSPANVRWGVIETIFTSSGRDLWIGTRQSGALRYNGRHWRTYQGKRSLVANTVRGLTETSDGTIWAATDRGFSRFDGHSWSARVLPAELNVPHEAGSLKSSPSGALWINRFDRNWTSRAWPRTRPPGTNCEFWTRCFRPQGPPPDTRITQGPKTVAQPGNISILWDGAAPWRDDPDTPLQYSYRLDDGPWSPYSPERGQSFFTLAGGPHHFEVRTRDKDFNADPTPASLDFRVLPPVWRQAWFLALIGVLGGLILAQATHVIRERHRLRITNRALAVEVEERTRVQARMEEAQRLLEETNADLDQRVEQRTSQLSRANEKMRQEMAERQKAEEARAEAQAERDAVEVQLRQSQKLEAVGQLAAGIAHEINTPTQFIGDNARFLKDSFNSIGDVLRAYDQLLQAARNGQVSPELITQVEEALEAGDIEFLFEQVPAAIKEALEGVDRVSRIVSAMKEFSHPGAKEKAPADLNQAIETTATVARNEWKYVADLELQLEPSLPQVPCFLGEMNQCILNLIVNAAHTIGDVVNARPGTKGKITVRTRHDGPFVEVRVEDTGTGIPEDVRDRVFDPFFTTKGVGKGTGQGLSMVYNTIVKQHGGTVAFETDMGKGTTFILRLPIIPASDGVETASNEEVGG